MITSSSDHYVGVKLAPFNPINVACATIALQMLEVGSLTAGSKFYDLGCGDGRVLIEACKINDSIYAVGIDYDLSLCARALRNIRDNGYDLQATVLHENVMDADLENASSLFIYLVPEGIRAIEEKLLAALARDVKIVTYVFSIPDLQPTRIEIYKGSTKLYLYTKSSLSAFPPIC
jgi:precorrin-6B methylase 2